MRLTIDRRNYDEVEDDIINPLVLEPEAWRRERPFHVAVIVQRTYGGTIYDARVIVERIEHLCDYILFDEAWAGS